MIDFSNLPCKGKIYWRDEATVIYCGDNRDILPELSGIDLVVTSPPYDDLREYGGHGFTFSGMPGLLYKAMSQGGVCVWVVGDQVKNRSETGSSFRQVLDFIDNGFNLHDTLIYQKNAVSLPDPSRYYQIFEYMFVLSKGTPKTFNPIKDRLRKWNGKSYYTRKRDRQGNISKSSRDPDIQDNKRGNIWIYDVGLNKGATDKITFQHPATFPDKLALDHIISWSNKDDLVLDPFLGSGTTCYCANKLGRKSIGIEISEKYCKIAVDRLRQGVMKFDNPVV